VLISLKSFLLTSYHPFWGRYDFISVQFVWPKRTIFRNLSFFIRKSCPSHLNFSLIIALKIGIKNSIVLLVSIWKVKPPLLEYPPFSLDFLSRNMNIQNNQQTEFCIVGFYVVNRRLFSQYIFFGRNCNLRSYEPFIAHLFLRTSELSLMTPKGKIITNLGNSQ